MINVGLNIWDTLGQEKFRSIAKIFFKGAAGAFIVFDVCNQESFNNLTTWIELINESCDTRIVMCIIGNKTEKFGRKVPYNVVKEFAYGHGLGYIEVSAKTGKNIKQSFECLARQIYELTPVNLDDTIVAGHGDENAMD